MYYLAPQSVYLNQTPTPHILSMQLQEWKLSRKIVKYLYFVLYDIVKIVSEWASLTLGNTTWPSRHLSSSAQYGNIYTVLRMPLYSKKISFLKSSKVVYKNKEVKLLFVKLQS